MAEKFIANAVPKSHRGIFRKKARAAGKTTHEYAEEHKHDSGKLGSEARLALTLMGSKVQGKRKKSAAETLYPKKD